MPQKLQELVRSGLAHFDGTEYHAVASDGTAVILGSKGNEDFIEEFLEDSPTPEHW